MESLSTETTTCLFSLSELVTRGVLTKIINIASFKLYSIHLLYTLKWSYFLIIQSTLYSVELELGCRVLQHWVAIFSKVKKILADSVFDKKLKTQINLKGTSILKFMKLDADVKLSKLFMTFPPKKKINLIWCKCLQKMWQNKMIKARELIQCI